jgi:hypothetical protein
MRKKVACELFFFLQFLILFPSTGPGGQIPTLYRFWAKFLLPYIREQINAGPKYGYNMVVPLTFLALLNLLKGKSRP